MAYLGPKHQLEVFKKALQEVPKSGEVWCEGARICLDPTSEYFCLESAEEFLKFGVTFTPQYGDSFIEYLKLEMLKFGVDNISEKLIQVCRIRDLI